MKLCGCYGSNVFLKIFNIQTIAALPEGRRLSFSALCFTALNVFCTVCEETLTPLWVFKLYFVGVGDLKGICCDFLCCCCCCCVAGEGVESTYETAVKDPLGSWEKRRGSVCR